MDNYSNVNDLVLRVLSCSVKPLRLSYCIVETKLQHADLVSYQPNLLFQWIKWTC